MSAAKHGTDRPSATDPGAEGRSVVPADERFAPVEEPFGPVGEHYGTGVEPYGPGADPYGRTVEPYGSPVGPFALAEFGPGGAGGLDANPLTLPRQRQNGAGPAALTLLVVGDDPTSAFTAPYFQEGGGPRVRLLRARNLTAAGRLLTDDVHCILLDLPDVVDSLRQVLRIAPGTAVLVLTDDADDGQAAEAVRVGAQDHLTRAEVDAATITRAVRYAVERKRADLALRQLTETRLLAQENSRLERGLLPTPLLEGAAGLRFAARYRPGRSRALLGGDFYDTVRTSDGIVHAMIGDVCGHGPDAAALGVELRIAWRALTFAGLRGAALLRTLQEVLVHERSDDEIFATLCTMDIAPDGASADLHLAGHPAPLLSGPGRVPALLPYEDGGPALGLLPDAEWQRIPVRLDSGWALMLYTDGLIEGRIGQGTQRLGQDGMIRIVARLLAAGLRGEDLLDTVVTEVRELNEGELTDDLAVVLLEHDDAS